MCGGIGKCDCPFDNQTENTEVVYQTHITLQDSKYEEEFRQIAEDLQLKVLTIANYLSDMTARFEVITSRTYRNTNFQDVLERLHYYVSEFEKNGVMISRYKIETVPWHPNVPDYNIIRHYDEKIIPHDFQYFESHVKLDKSNFYNVELGSFKNIFNKIKKWNERIDKSQVLMVSLVDFDNFYLTKRSHNITVDRHLNFLELFLDGVPYEGPIRTEFVAVDSNEKIDKVWVDSWKQLG